MVFGVIELNPISKIDKNIDDMSMTWPIIEGRQTQPCYLS